MSHDFRITRGYTGRSLHGLLRASIATCDRFLVTLTGMELNPAAVQLLASLDPYLMSREQTNETPAGSLPWGTVEARTYRLVPESLDLLQSATDSLFSWQEPDLPNDLCLLAGEQPWLVTMASDRVAVMVLDDDEARQLTRNVEGLSLVPTDP